MPGKYVCSSTKTPHIIILLGIFIIPADIMFYPYFLPRLITSENATSIQLLGYTFYLILFSGISMLAIGTSRIIFSSKGIQYNEGNNYYFDNDNYNNNRYHFNLWNLLNHVFSIITHILHNRKYFTLFCAAAIIYGLSFSTISGMIIYRAEGLAHHYGTAAPSIIIMSYGPVGYVPTVALAITDNFGMLIIPINLIVMIVVSFLVGMNIMLSIYAFKNRPKENNKTRISTLGMLGATAGLFTTCPTCASLFILNFLSGSLASGVAAFTAKYYPLFITITIPLLIATLAMTVLGIRNTISASTSCSFKR